MPIHTDHPWLPAETDETFDPLDHAGVSPDSDTPILITPRGGAREVGRSCYQVDTEYATYLVDCGLNQGTGDQFPDDRGLGPEAIDAVFLTHAHIDHCSGLPVFEARGLLDDDTPIVATPPTIGLATLLLRRETADVSCITQNPPAVGRKEILEDALGEHAVPPPGAR